MREKVGYGDIPHLGIARGQPLVNRPFLCNYIVNALGRINMFCLLASLPSPHGQGGSVTLVLCLYCSIGYSVFHNACVCERDACSGH